MNDQRLNKKVFLWTKEQNCYNWCKCVRNMFPEICNDSVCENSRTADRTGQKLQRSDSMPFDRMSDKHIPSMLLLMDFVHNPMAIL